MEPILGSNRFLQLYLLCIVAGALTWLAVHWTGTDVLMGASAGVMGLLITFCALYPNDTITALLFFVI
ncbi:MAG TPA: rhomboid family intramembrane serine protease, partial [Opitutales bacterium]|nr:rhomboid family intramembrane serine protease [Opitutales bacterium]